MEQKRCLLKSSSRAFAHIGTLSAFAVNDKPHYAPLAQWIERSATNAGHCMGSSPLGSTSLTI